MPLLSVSPGRLMWIRTRSRRPSWSLSTVVSTNRVSSIALSSEKTGCVTPSLTTSHGGGAAWAGAGAAAAASAATTSPHTVPRRESIAGGCQNTTILTAWLTATFPPTAGQWTHLHFMQTVPGSLRAVPM